jgi:methionine-gamma-lyase
MDKEMLKKGLGRNFNPESLMMSYGYKPEWSEGAVKCPIFQTSTFVFKNAEEGKSFFEVAHGLREPRNGETVGLIYSRINNPDLEILEDRLTLWDDAEDCAVFESGMAAIATTVLELLKPGDILLHSGPLYGGTYSLFEYVLPKYGIQAIDFGTSCSKDDIIERVNKAGFADKVAMIFIETPANPTNALVDMAMCVEIAQHFSNEKKQVIKVIDNTFLGPVFQHPIKHGFDLVIYSATKYIGGHSDLIAGACLGRKSLISRVKTFRALMGSMAGPWTGWLIMRSLETLKLRMTAATETAKEVAEFLVKHPKVEEVYYLGLIKDSDPQYEIYKRQCLAPGAMISFDIKGGEKEAFKFLNSLKMIKLAVSLGGTESLAEHPAAMTHSDIEPKRRTEFGITDKMIRLSVGLEAPDDLKWDLEQALKTI